MKNHFRAHQLSIWLRLIPELHRAGMEDVIARHNMFKNHDDAELYEGPVKPDVVSRLTFLDGSNVQRRGNGSEYGEYMFDFMVEEKPRNILLFATHEQLNISIGDHNDPFISSSFFLKFISMLMTISQFL